MITAHRLETIISGDVDLRSIEPDIYSVLSPDEESVSYDKAFGTVYDRVACNRIYNRLVWGYATAEYQVLCRDALASSAAGWVLDAGCGSLAFTAGSYAEYCQRPVVLLDRSLKLLRIAKSRLAARHGRVPENTVFLHADVLRLPFKRECFGTVISLNLLHVFADDGLRRVLQEMQRVLMDSGALFLTTLVESGRMADRYLRMWGRAGELVPRNAKQLLAIFDALGMSADCRIAGNLAFLTAAGFR